MYFAPVNSNLESAPLFIVGIGQSFDRFILSGEIGYSRISHDQSFQSAFDVTITQERYYDYFSFQGHLSFIPFPELESFQPYAGIFAGYGSLTDYRKKETENNNTEKLVQQDRLNLGLKAGLNIFPYSKVSLFIEGRYLYTPKKVTRNVYESQGILGDLVARETEYYFNAFTFGGGIKYYLD